MTVEELRAEAKKQGYSLVKRGDWDCECSAQYPNTSRKQKNGKWICVDKYECVRDLVQSRQGGYDYRTRCRRKVQEIMNDKLK